jgi:hypothetical protein
VTGEALHRLNDAEYAAAWERFDSAFTFRPSLTEFPGIQEPAPSVTWSLDVLDDDPNGHRRDLVIDAVQDGLTACTPPGASLLILDWHHTCYALRPDLPPTDMFLPAVVEGRAQPGWPLSPYPDEDYTIFLAEDFSFGTFAHPWEPSLCLFGAPLLDKTANAIHRIMPTVLRRDGRPRS